jgi:hypothetical protein
MTRFELLAEYGIKGAAPFRVMPMQEAGILWWVGVAAFGDPLRSITAAKAAELASRLAGIGEDELSHRISKAAEEVQRHNTKDAAS